MFFAHVKAFWFLFFLLVVESGLCFKLFGIKIFMGGWNRIINLRQFSFDLWVRFSCRITVLAFWKYLFLRLLSCQNICVPKFAISGIFMLNGSRPPIASCQRDYVIVMLPTLSMRSSLFSKGYFLLIFLVLRVTLLQNILIYSIILVCA